MNATHELLGFEKSENGKSVRWICSCSLKVAGRATEEKAREAWEHHAGGNIAYRVEHGMTETSVLIPPRPLEASRPACSGCFGAYGLTRCTDCGRSWCKECGGGCRNCASKAVA